MITTRPHGRPNGALLARIQRRLTPRWQTVAQIAGDDMVGDVARALSTLERDGLAEREGQRWRAPQPPEQAPAPELVAEPVVEPAAIELVPPVVPPPPPAPAPPVDLPAAVQEAARRRDWWTRTEIATSVEIRTGAGRGSIEVEIARQLDDGRLEVGALGIRIRVPPELPAEPEPTTAEQGQAAARALGAVTKARVLEALRVATPGLTLRELGAAVGITSSRAGQIARELGCHSVAEAPGRTARRRWYPPGWSQPAPLAPLAPHQEGESHGAADGRDDRAGQRPDGSAEADGPTPPSPEPGSQTLEHLGEPQAPASGGVQVDDGLATPTRPLIGGQLLPELGHLAEENALLAQAAHVERCDGCGGRRDDFYVVPMAAGGHALLCGCGIVIAARPEAVRQAPEPSLAVEAPAVGDRGWWFGLGPGELAETAKRLQEELDALRRPHVEPCPDAITLRAILAVLDLLDRPGVDPVARVALLVGECRAMRRAAS